MNANSLSLVRPLQFRSGESPLELHSNVENVFARSQRIRAEVRTSAKGIAQLKSADRDAVCLAGFFAGDRIVGPRPRWARGRERHPFRAGPRQAFVQGVGDQFAIGETFG